MHNVYYLKSNNINQHINLTITESIKLEIISTAPKNGFYLYHENNSLVLAHSNLELTLCVDFSKNDMQNRIKPNIAKLDLIKAVEGRTKNRLNILDMTAGLGQDSFLLAARGHTIDAIEQNPYVYLLLKAGLKYAKKSPNLAETAHRISLYFTNFITFNSIQKIGKYDVIYLDPMFPERRKSAKVKKNMQLLHKVVGIDEQSNHLLFKKAKEFLPKKIIVKRPYLGDFIDDKKPTSQLIGKSSRFDIYALHNYARY